MKKYIISVAIILLVLIMSVTIRIVEPKKVKVTAKESVTTYMLADTYLDSGIIANNEGIINFTDIKSRATVALCDKPSCKHNTKECNAFVGQTDLLAIYNNKLYFIQSVEGEKTFSKFLFQSDLNGGNRKRVAEIKDVNAIIKSKFIDGKLIINTVQTADDTTFMKLENEIVGLVSIDLESYEVQYIFKSDKTCGNIREFNYIKDENKILYSLEHLNAPKLEFKEQSIAEIRQYYNSLITELYSYDVKTKQRIIKKELKGVCLNALVQNKAIFTKMAISNEPENILFTSSCIYDYKSNTEKEIEAIDYNPYAENGKDIFTTVYNPKDDTNTFFYLDTKTRTYKEIIKKERTVLLGLSGNCIYISMKNKKGEDWAYVMEISEFLKGDLSSAKPMKKSFDN